jgi:glucarate dehydratase
MSNAYTFSVGKLGGTTKIIVEVETNAGIVGVGETYPVWTRSLIEEVIAPRLIGENPFNLERIASKCLPTNANPSLPYVDAFHLLGFGGVEMALWDVAGKACDVPAAMLMGGVYRDKIAFCEYVFAEHQQNEDDDAFIENVVKYCKNSVTNHHSPVLEMKVGVLQPRKDIEMVKRVREAVGEGVTLRVDANCAWTESTALRTVREFENLSVGNVEEPCRTLEANGRIRSSVNLPISVHSTRVSELAKYGLDVAVVNPLSVGGFRRLKQQAAIAEDIGMDMWLHSRAELGFATAAYLQFLASTRHTILPSQSLIRPTEDFLTKEGKPQFENGFMSLPDAPGLGVTLDHGKLDKYNQLFEEEGEYEWLNGTGRSPPFY